MTEHTAIIADRRDRLRLLLSAIIKPDARFVWEVGSGHGHFLAAYAASHPDETCIGVDIASERIARADRKRERSPLPRLHFVRADAGDFIAAMPERARFTSIYILFPDPWPKRRHHKNRLMKPDFLAAAAARSATGARIYFRTDYEPYFREAAGVISDQAAWMLTEKATLPFEEPTVFQKRAARHFTLVATRR